MYGSPPRWDVVYKDVRTAPVLYYEYTSEYRGIVI